LAANRLQELFTLLDRLEELVAPNTVCTCTFKDKLFTAGLLDNKKSIQPASSTSAEITHTCQCGSKAAKNNILEYAWPTAHAKEVVE
jgi:hypothetical protein